MKKKITLKDIAKILGISVATVSRVLNDKPDVSELTRYKVKKLIKAYNYKPNTLAIKFRQHKSGIIGVIVPRLPHYFFSMVFSGILNVANRKGYSIMLYETNNDFEKEIEYIDILMNNNVDGLLISLSKTTSDFDHLQKIKEEKIPIVLFDNVSEYFNGTKVIVDDTYGAFKAVEHLIKSGRKKIAHIKGNKTSLVAKKRLDGYINALQKYEFQIENSIILECIKVNDEEGYSLTKQLLSLPENNLPDAIFVVTDEVAVGVIKALKEANKKIPDEIAVVGFSDSVVAKVTEPQLTTVQQPGVEMGKRAVEILINKIEKGEDRVFTEVLNTQLIIRGSSV